MNVRLKKTWGWYGGMLNGETFIANHWSCTLDLLTVSDDLGQQNLAFERARYFMHNILDDAILINRENPLLDRYQATGARIIPLPGDPVDQIIGMMLYLKLNAVMENRIVITDVECWSQYGESLSYMYSHGDSLGPFEVDGWYSDPRPIWYDTRPQNQGNVVNIDRAPEWKDFDLEWETEDKTKNSVVFAKFNRDDDK